METASYIRMEPVSSIQMAWFSKEAKMNRYYLIDADDRKVRYFAASIFVGYVLCAIIGWRAGISWPQIVGRFS